MEALLAQAPDVPMLWAHGGFDVPEARLRALLEAFPALHLELSFRAGVTEDGRLTPTWRALFTDFPTRCLLGMDTYVPGRWVELPELAAAAREWLRQLPAEVARAVARGNAERLFPLRPEGPVPAPLGGGTVPGVDSGPGER
jgi:predicted TIM-barrel fold metal-dependent hydrolase